MAVWALAAPPAEMPSAVDFPSEAIARTDIAQDGRRTIGYVEYVVIEPGNLRLKAKIDTGAKSSSIDAINILPFTRDGKQWVRFSVVIDDDQHLPFELPVVRTVGVKRANAPMQRRYVVELGICLGGVFKKSDVNLVNRNGMNYRMLIGRLFLDESFVVDPASNFLASPSCKVPGSG